MKLLQLMFVVLIGSLAFSYHAQTAQAASCPIASPDLGSASLAIPDTLAAGTYKAWVRMRLPNSSGNAIGLEIGDSCLDVGDGGTPTIGPNSNQWAWVDWVDGNVNTKATFTLPAGTGRLFRLVGRKADVDVDRVLLLTSTDTCQPDDNQNYVYNVANPTAPAPGDKCVATASLPAPTLTLPKPGAVVKGKTPLTVTVTGGVKPYTHVQYFVNFTKIADVVTNSTAGTKDPGTNNYGALYVWDSSAVKDGDYIMSAKVFDTNGNSGLSPGVKITITNKVVLTTTLSGPAANSTVKGTVVVYVSATGGTPPYKHVQYFANGVQIADVTVSLFGAPLSWDTTKVADGNYTITAKLYDSDNVSADSAGLSLIVKNH